MKYPRLGVLVGPKLSSYAQGQKTCAASGFLRREANGVAA